MRYILALPANRLTATQHCGTRPGTCHSVRAQHRLDVYLLCAHMTRSPKLHQVPEQQHGTTPSPLHAPALHASQLHQQWVLVARIVQRFGHCATVQTAVTPRKLQRQVPEHWRRAGIACTRIYQVGVQRKVVSGHINATVRRQVHECAHHRELATFRCPPQDTVVDSCRLDAAVWRQF